MTPADERSARLATGLTIASETAPTLNGTYAMQPSDQAAIQALVLYIVVNGHFPAGQAQWPWADVDGVIHLFAPDQFKGLATAIADYVAGVELGLRQDNPIWPSTSATIA